MQATLSAYENVELPMSILSKLDAAARKTRAQKLLRLVGLEDRMSHLPSELSGGEQQRVTIGAGEDCGTVAVCAHVAGQWALAAAQLLAAHTVVTLAAPAQHAHWPTRRICCCWTSRRAIWTHATLWR
mgnify:CR=1 FL=1